MTVQIKTTDSFVFVKVKISSLGTLFFFLQFVKKENQNVRLMYLIQGQNYNDGPQSSFSDS